MAWNLIGQTFNGAVSPGLTVTAPSAGSVDTTGADLIVAVVGINSNSVPDSTSLTDFVSNGYTLLRTQASDGDANQKCLLYYKTNPTTSVTHSWTFSNGSFTFPSIVVFVFTGLAASPSINSVGSGTGTTSLQAGSIGIANDLVVAALSWNPNNGMSTDPGFYRVQIGNVTGEHVGSALAWKEVTGAENPTWSWTGSNNAAGVNASFTGTGGATVRVPFSANIGAKRV